MEELAAYLGHLENLQGVSGLHTSPTKAHRDDGYDAKLTVRTHAGSVHLLAIEFKSHLGHAAVEHVIARARRAREPVLVLAPHIGAGIGAKLADAGINYVDRHGNCHIAVRPLYIHVEGRTGPAHAGPEKGLRAPGYQVLFAYLAEPELLEAPIRTVAEWAGVSRQPISDVRRRLIDDGYLAETKSGTRWFEHRRNDALSLWLHGYETTVRPSLLWGTYRTRTDPDQLENRIASLDVSGYRWGGTTAGFRLTKHYRGPRTTVHVRATPPDLRTQLDAITDPGGNLVFLDAFGDINWQPDTETVHPLLVYSEMLREGDERAREAAEELFEKFLRRMWGKTR